MNYADVANLSRRASPTNALYGIVPTFTGFDDVNPNNLANATDGDITTSTGAGSKAVTGVANFGSFNFDLGSVKTVLVSGEMGLYCNGQIVNVYFLFSRDGTTFYTHPVNVSQLSATSEQVKALAAWPVTARYLRLQCNTGGTGTGNASIKTLAAHELKLSTSG